MNKICLICFFLICYALPVCADLFNAHEFFLDNGLHVVVIENHKSPIVKHMVWYKVGKANEEFGKGGSAHLLEHLMFRGTKSVKDGEFNNIMNKYGIEDNAFTGHDVTVYHQLADISKLEALMALEADRMQNLNFNEQAFESERKIVFQERQQVIENNPSSAFNERLSFLLWGKTPYGHPVTGLNEEIKALKYGDIYDFYYKYYAPNNAILIISGDIDLAQAKELSQKYYGNIQPKKIIYKKQDDISDNYIETLTMKLPNIKSEKMVMKFLLPHYEKLQGSLYDYLVLAEYLGGGETSALYRDLVVDQQIAFDVSADYNFLAGINSLFSVALRPKHYFGNETWDLLRNAMNDAVKKLNVRKLEKIKKKILSDLVYVNDNPSDAAYWIGYMLAFGLTLEEVQKYEQGIQSVDLQGVRKAFDTLLQSSRVEGTLLPL